MPDAKKIFLSHRGVDQGFVRDFRDTLALLGFDPWFAEEMTAGLNPDRAIRQGFKDSCAAVFFITPSFKDESWLADEIEYARVEKREKGDRFQIISLVFKDSEGNKGVVPELLGLYIHKEPNTTLEALREILRALPICVGMVDWKYKNIRTSEQASAISDTLEESKRSEYTLAKKTIAEWADKHPRAFQPDQILGPGNFGPKLHLTWQDYDSETNSALQDARSIFNKFWDRLVTRFEASHTPYDRIFEDIGDNLWLMSITHPLEILLAQKLRTRGKPTLETLLDRFTRWVESDPKLRLKFAEMGFRVGQEASIWTQKWPWRK